VFNVRIEGDTDANLFYTDATNDRVGIGIIAPTEKLDVVGKIKLSDNLVIGTSGKGIDFSATAGTGTSELLADYEEGTWTPNQGSGLSFSGAFSSSGIYTKIGNLVTVSFRVNGTNIGCSAGGEVTSNLPFSIAASPGNAMGSIQNSNNVLSGAYGFLTSVSIASVALPTTAAAILVTITYQV
jgi:hypothetical protein